VSELREADHYLGAPNRHGPRLQMLTEEAETNRRIEQEFARWSKVVGVAKKLRS
jgi:hypothetical protein